MLAQDVWRLRTLRWHAETSMLKTLAVKHQSTVSTMAARHRAKAKEQRFARSAEPSTRVDRQLPVCSSAGVPAVDRPDQAAVPVQDSNRVRLSVAAAGFELSGQANAIFL